MLEAGDAEGRAGAGAERPLAEVILDVLDDDEQRRTRVAWLYHVEGRTQAEIAERLGVSRIKVVRDLAACRETGLVQVRINGRLASCVALERRLEERFGLRQAVVIPTPGEPEDVPAALGVAVGAYLSDRLAPGLTVGIGWGRTLRWGVRATRRRAVPGLTVVSLLGGLGRGSEINPYETASRLADALGAQCYYLAAPTFATTAGLRDMLVEQPGIGAILERGRRADAALVSVGSLAPGSTNRRLGLLTDADAAELLAAGAVGDLLGHYVAADGAVVDHPLNRRVVGLAPGDLRGVPLAILASGGADKVGVVGGALAGRYVNTLITDEATAAALA